MNRFGFHRVEAHPSGLEQVSGRQEPVAIVNEPEFDADQLLVLRDVSSIGLDVETLAGPLRADAPHPITHGGQFVGEPVRKRLLQAAAGEEGAG